MSNYNYKNNFYKVQLLETTKGIYLRLKNIIKAKLDSESIKLFKNSSWIFTAHLIFVSGLFAQSVILGRVLGVRLYGTYVLIIAFVDIIQKFLTLNVDMALIKYISGYKSANDFEKVAAFVKGSFIFAIISSIVSVLVIISLVFFAYHTFVKQPGLEIYIIAYAVANSFSFFNSINSGLLRVYDKFSLNSTIRIFLTFVEFAFVIIAVLFFPRQLSMIFVAIIGARIVGGIASTGATIWAFRENMYSFFYVKLSIIREQWKEIRKFVLSQSASNILKILIFRGDVVVLGMMAGSFQVGLYAVAKKLAFSILLITDPMYASIYPQLASLVSQQRFNDIKMMLKKVSKILIIPLILFFLCASLFNKWIMNLIYGGEYIAAGKPFLFLLLTVCIAAFFFWIGPLLLSLGRAFFRLKVDVVVYAVGALLAFFLAPLYGAVGVAIALLTINLISHSIFLYAVKRDLG